MKITGHISEKGHSSLHLFVLGSHTNVAASLHPSAILSQSITLYSGVQARIAHIRIVLATNSVHVSLPIVTLSKTSPFCSFVNNPGLLYKSAHRTHNVTLNCVSDQMRLIALLAPFLAFDLILILFGCLDLSLSSFILSHRHLFPCVQKIG